MSAGIEFNANVLNQLGTPAMNSNLFANRPAAGFTGRIFISTDTLEIYRDTGTTWELIGSGGGSVNIYNSNGTLTGVRTLTQNNNELTFIGGLVNFGAHGSATDTRNIRVNQYASLGTITIGSYGAVGSNFYVSGGGSLRTLTDSSSAIHFLSGGHVFLNGGNGVANSSITWTEAGRILSNGRLLWNTTTDAGFLADFNGTVAVRNSFTQFGTGSVATFGNGLVLDRDGGTTRIFNGPTINYQANTSTLVQHNFTNQVGFNNAAIHSIDSGTGAITATSGNVDTARIIGRKAAGSGTANFTSLRIAQTVENNGTFAGIHRGLWYSPTLVGSFNHIALQTDSGTVDHYDRSDLTTSNFSDRNIWTLHARLRQTLSAGADQAGAGYYVGGLHIREISASGANTYGNATINAGGASTLQIDFTGAGTLTASQSGLRAFAGHQIFNTFGGSASGTITHFAGMQILGLYNRNSGVITPTITNAYGLVINNLNDYSHTFTLTNRWGVYQTGASDNNYLAGKLLVGTTTVTARQVHINGNIELTTTLAGTAGGSSGQHLSIWANGNEYKIALLNP